MKWAVVVPSNRPERLKQFRAAWSSVFREHNPELILVHDGPKPTNQRFGGTQEFHWEDVPDWIPRKTDMIRSWGFYQAWKTDCDYVLSLDDDVLPQGDPFAAYERAFEREWPCSEYLSVGSLTDTDLEMRGFPYRGRSAEAAVQYGGWIGVPDLDAATQIQSPCSASAFWRVVVPVPKGAAVTCCAMNFAFRREYTPIMWQLPMLEGRYNRFGDIWSGLIQKRVLDALGKVMLVNGQAGVVHDRASDPFVNLMKEAPGLEPNEELWKALRYPGLRAPMLGAFRATTDSAVAFFRKRDPAYAAHFKESRDSWLSLFV